MYFILGDRKLTAGINIKTDHVKLMLEHGADPNKKNNAGNTPMHLTDCSSEYLALLMSYGGSVVVQNNNGETPLETQLKVRVSIHILQYRSTNRVLLIGWQRFQFRRVVV